MSDSKVINDSNDFVPMPTPDRVVEGEYAERLDPIQFQFNDIRAMAQKILKRAQEQGQAKIEAARKQVAAMEKEGYDKAYKEAFPKGEKEGFAKGEKDGMAMAEKRIAESVEAELKKIRDELAPVKGILEQIASIMNENRQALLAQAEADLLLLALDIAKRLLGRELSFDADAIRPIATEAIGLVTDRSAVTIRVCPADYEAMERCLPDIKSMFPDAGVIQLETDDSLERGGLIAATRESEVDMRLATRLSAFEEAILGFSGTDAVAPWSSLSPDTHHQQLEAPKQPKPPEPEPEPPSPMNDQPPQPAEPEAVEPPQPEPQEQVREQPQEQQPQAQTLEETHAETEAETHAEPPAPPAADPAPEVNLDEISPDMIDDLMAADSGEQTEDRS